MSYIVYSENAIQDVHTTVDDIKTIFSQLNNSAAGHDELPPSILMQLCNEYCIPLSYIINSSVIQGDFPEEMKLAKVIKINKADNEQHKIIQNYRHISVLPFFKKYSKRSFIISCLNLSMQTIFYMKNSLDSPKGMQQVMLL